MSPGAVAVAPDVAAREVGGGVRVREKVWEKVVRQAAAGAVGVPRSEVDIDVAEWRDGLAVRVSARLPVFDLEDTERIRQAGPLTERIRRIQQQLADDLSRLTGRRVSRVSFEVTGAIIAERKRVR